MTTYLVTGGTGLIGRNLIPRLLARPDTDTVLVLVRKWSRDRLAALAEHWPAGMKVRALTGDLTAPALGLPAGERAELAGTVDHLVHLAAVYDLTAGEEANRAANVDGTARVVELANELSVGCLHHVSSVAVAGDHKGTFAEEHFDVGQRLPSPYHATKFEAEALVRTKCRVPWRVYRPAVVVGDSRTGEMTKVDGPYYVFPIIGALGRLPGRPPVPVPDMGATNLVPVDYVADAMAHLMHADGLDRRAFHLVNPKPQPVVEVFNAFAAQAGAPRAVAVIPRRLAEPVTTVARPLLGLVGRAPVAGLAFDVALHQLGIPPQLLAHASFPSVFASDATRAALAGSGLTVPRLHDYAGVLWQYWREHLDPDRARRGLPGGPLAGRRVVITGASSGIGRATAVMVARRGGVPLLVARRTEELEQLRAEIERAGGQAHVYSCDLTQAESVETLVKRMIADQPGIDMLVNNAGRSIRRSIRHSYDRFHDYERTMALNYFGALRLTLRLLPHMAERRFGHIVNISSIGVQANPPRFSAYVASKAALDAFARIAASEVYGDGISFTTIHMPLVRTPMIRPTKIYNAFPAKSADEAAEMVVRALVERPKHIGTPLGTFGAVSYTLAPRLVHTVLNVAYQAFPDSAAAGTTSLPNAGKAIMRLLPGVHW